MTRNSKKFQKKRQPVATKKVEQKEEKQEPSNPFGISFVVPTEFVTLPTKGKLYPKTSPLHDAEQVELRHMTAKDEDVISTISAATGEKVFEKLLNNLIVDPDIKASDLCEEDKTALLLSARVTGYGPEYAVNDFCEECAGSRKYIYDLTKVEIIQPDREYIYDPDLNTYTITLPVSKLEVMLKELDDEQIESISRDRAQKQKHGIPFNELVALLRELIVSANNVSDPAMIHKLIEVLPAADAKVMKSFLQAVNLESPRYK